MKLHRNICEGILFNLDQIFFKKKFADKAIEQSLKSNKKWGSRDRKFIAETTYTIVRYWRMLNEMMRINAEENSDYLWKLFAGYLLWKNIPLPLWDEFSSIDKDKISIEKNSRLNERKIKESIPDWLDELGEKELGNKWDSEIAALNKEAPVILRANTLKISKEQLIEKFLEIGIQTFPLDFTKDALLVEQRQNLFQTPYFKEGYFELQDASSQLVANYLDVKPGMRVVDACAGAGGKSLHIAALMQNKGKVLALDTEEWKLNELKKRANRNGISIIETRTITSSKVIKRLADSADRVLLDVPCSGLGVLRRNPDAKWKLTNERIEELKSLQQKILESYSTMVKPNGKIVYSTCSILPSENEGQIERFFSSESNRQKFKLIEERKISPAVDGFDGFYISVLQRFE
ncbi:MAG: RNA methyltransferase [Ignavibacteria bacterium CG_4_8_14_3_um_filter_37_9]|nr:RsmB/NOP family class I SAM-dependent RNA methyltransferase [Ignavibacteria bacterium]NCS82500.1 RsmB/NOP family class I SAM-dependent RNA methyltransferase [Ignavibacteria bacterium]OIO22431.1 MAG: RNA methyltransferase [Ignavibacteria bacterium CG1_02_37_35]PIW99396.1 MAG: RNA methyltransferase [Ignavibacteria bacterium CG_4_8_14_3_um_filter_37_9]